MSRTLVVVALIAGSSFAEEPKPKDPKLKGSMKQSAPKITLDLPTFNTIPTGEGMKKVEEKPVADRPTTTEGQASYTVVSVQHGKSFIRTPTGSKPSAPYPSVTASGNPLMTEKFTTVIRVKAPDKKTTSIEVAVLDPRGDTTMSANGRLSFKADEQDWTVDWDPTGIRNAGDYQVLVRVGGNPLGTFPLKIEAKE